MIMKVLKNYAYNLSYQLLVIILPIITTPYVTRVFSSEDLGTYGYFNSIVTYFILLATFARLPFEISRSNWLESSPSSCLSNLPMIFISMYSYSLFLSS